MALRIKSLVFIADYGTDSLTTTEVLLALRPMVLEDFTPYLVATRPFNTLHTGFLLAQLQRQLSAKQARDTVFFLNTDPRLHTKERAIRAEGSPLLAAFLNNGSIVITPNAGHCLSFVKSNIRRLITLPVEVAGSQFRSRDLFPVVVAQALNEKLLEESGSTLELAVIPDLPNFPFVLHTDNYGNIKTSFTTFDFEKLGWKYGDWVDVKIGDSEIRRLHIAETIFTCEPGELVFAPGSSGERDNPYFECSLRFNGGIGDSAGRAFRSPEPGMKISLVQSAK